MASGYRSAHSERKTGQETPGRPEIEVESPDTVLDAIAAILLDHVAPGGSEVVA